MTWRKTSGASRPETTSRPASVRRRAGVKPLLVRAVGPSLEPLIGPGALPDAILELYAGQALVGGE